jgi:hypothetical protein
MPQYNTTIEDYSPIVRPYHWHATHTDIHHATPGCVAHIVRSPTLPAGAVGVARTIWQICTPTAVSR